MVHIASPTGAIPQGTLMTCKNLKPVGAAPRQGRVLRSTQPYNRQKHKRVLCLAGAGQWQAHKTYTAKCTPCITSLGYPQPSKEPKHDTAVHALSQTSNRLQPYQGPLLTKLLSALLPRAWRSCPLDYCCCCRLLGLRRALPWLAVLQWWQPCCRGCCCCFRAAAPAAPCSRPLAQMPCAGGTAAGQSET